MKTRFCPSPTGNITLGNARTALFCSLYARNQQGSFLLRIEDTDQERSEKIYVEQLAKDLRWLDLPWQEGAFAGGDAGPYWQSERQAIYDKYYDILEERGLTYPCFCTPEQLELSRKLQRAQGKPPRYAGTCAALKPEDIAARLAKGEKATLRFRVKPKSTVQFHDLVKGRQRFNTEELGDFIIRRTDKTAPFLFCNAIDDALMGVTDVLRGDDHLTNTPRQLLILEALDLPAPRYGHLSLIMGSDGAPLSKRTGSKSIKELQELGYLPLAIVNYLARLGHYYSDTHFMTLDQLSQGFAIENLAKSPARFDQNQMDYWQKEAVAQSSNEFFWQWLSNDTRNLIPNECRELFIETVKPNVLFPQDVNLWARRFFADELHLDMAEINILMNTGSQFFQESLAIFQESGTNWQLLAEGLKHRLGVKGKALFEPIRVALTGETHGPELAKIIQVLGETKVKNRLQQALELSTRG